MKDLLKYELFRLKRNRLFIIFSIVAVGISLFMLLLMILSAKLSFTGGMEMESEGAISPEIPNMGGMTGMILFMLFPNGFNSLAMFASISVFPVIFLSIGIAGSITQEYRQGTMRNLVMSGKPRESIYFSKLIISLAVNIIFVVIMALVYFSICSIIFGVGKVDALPLLRAIGLTLAATVAIACLIVFLSFWLKNSAPTIVMIAVVTYALYSVGMLASSLQIMLEEGIFKGIVTAVGYIADAYPPITIQYAFSYSITWQTAVRFFLCSLGFIGLCTFGGLTLFKKKDLK